MKKTEECSVCRGEGEIRDVRADMEDKPKKHLMECSECKGVGSVEVDLVLNLTEIHEIKEFEIEAKTKLDARNLLENYLSSEDKIISLTSTRRQVYLAKIRVFIMRENPSL